MKLPEGVALPGGGDSLLAFDVDEEHQNWGALSSLFQRWRASDVTRTEFTKKEIDSARWLEIGAWHHGYPQPAEDVFGYRQATYDLTDWCEKCGIGMKQKAPFQMKGEPKWGRNAIMQLVWIYGELFVTPDVWNRVFEPAHVECRPVLNTKGAELKTVVQLVVQTTASIITEGLPAEQCERCGRTKYLPITRGPFPALRDTPVGSMLRTAEYFGSGAQADQHVLMSQDLARSLAKSGVRGASLKPVVEPK
ncbi:hypothetical protein [Pyxidicoccus trucidator]|uniref:hypothetical protein n=1 Tax=Pyxidicoccus trucidator TaxID=2709662 RepID=UPI001967549A|nr:hypothetical protein [Pyxidicoccus trucidator]